MGIKFIEQKWLFLFGVEGEVWLADWGQSADFWFGFRFHLFSKFLMFYCRNLLPSVGDRLLWREFGVQSSEMGDKFGEVDLEIGES